MDSDTDEEDNSIRVLHVDDDPDLAELTATFLTRKDDRMSINTATTASEGLNCLSESGFDCIISDYDMPGQNGVEFLKTIREDHPDLPFILFTGKGSEEVASDAISAGVTEYLQKGSGTEQYSLLANRVQNVVERYWFERDAEHARARIQEIADKREKIIERVTDAIVEMDAHWQFTLVNAQAENLYEMSEKYLLGRDFWEVFDSAKGTRLEEEFRTVMQTRNPTSFVEYSSQLDGWFDISVYPKDDGGIALYFIDITEQRKRKQDLKEERQFISETLDMVEEFFFVIGSNWELERWNGHVEKVTGFSETDVETMNALDFFPADERKQVTKSLEKTAETGSDKVEAEIRTVDGTRIPYQFLWRRLTDAKSELFGIAGIGRDITDLRAQEQELRETKRRLELVLEGTETGIWEWKIGTDEIEWDDTLEQIFGLEPGSFGGTYDAFAKRVHPDDLPRVEEAMDQAIENDELYHTEFRMIHEDGETVWAEVQGITISQENEPDRLIGLYHEISERKQREEQLETFASVVSHDLRNPLNVASGYLDLAQQECESDNLENVAQALERMRVLIEDLLTMARQGDPVGSTEPVDLARLTEKCWNNIATAEATLTTNISGIIRANESRVQQLLENLMRNAVEHGGEEVTVTVEDLETGFCIEDDGPGIPEGDRPDVFEMGYSKREGGTGFGMSIAKQVADAHNWEIRVTDGSNGGARIEVTGVEFAAE
ncbi:PAS domain S-box protein [Halobium palmae]|uniref:histidine kinase n=1 Tax=Halobium palmae TaxID=1776492 RepID=A0ABD5RUE2_9EURY